MGTNSGRFPDRLQGEELPQRYRHEQTHLIPDEWNGLSEENSWGSGTEAGSFWKVQTNRGSDGSIASIQFDAHKKLEFTVSDKSDTQEKDKGKKKRKKKQQEKEKETTPPSQPAMELSPVPHSARPPGATFTYILHVPP